MPACRPMIQSLKLTWLSVWRCTVSTGLCPPYSSPLIGFTWIQLLSSVLWFSVWAAWSVFFCVGLVERIEVHVEGVSCSLLAWLAVHKPPPCLPCLCRSWRFHSGTYRWQRALQVLNHCSSFLSALPSLCLYPVCLPACDPPSHTLSLRLSVASFPRFRLIYTLFLPCTYLTRLHPVLCGVWMLMSEPLPLAGELLLLLHLFHLPVSSVGCCKLVKLGSVKGHLWIIMLMMCVHVELWRQLNIANMSGCHTV